MPDMSNWRVLLVDDEPDSLNLISEMIAHNGAEVHMAASGSECIELLTTVDPTLIVLDLQMPRPDGWELLSFIRSNPATSALPVVATTAYHSSTVEREALDVGFDAYMPKPLKSQVVLDTLAKVVS